MFVTNVIFLSVYTVFQPPNNSTIIIESYLKDTAQKALQHKIIVY